MPALPALGSTSWYTYATALDSGVRNGGIVAAVTTGGTAAANSTALNAAITAAAAGPGAVLIPAGTYAHQGFTLPATGAVTIRGAARGKTVLNNTHATNASVTAHGAGGGSYCIEWALSDLTLTASAVRTAQVGLDIELANRFRVENVTISSHGEGVRNKASWECTYDTVSAYVCTIGWNFPAPSPFTVSCPITVSNGSALSCGTAVISNDSVEVLNWTGGDFSGCTTGVVLTGNQTRLVKFDGINFEGITNDDIVLGDATTGPASVNFVSCRFSRPSLVAGSRSAHILRGVGVKFDTCWWGNYATGILQDSPAGDLVIVSPAGFNVTTFLNTNGVIPAWGYLVVVRTPGSPTVY